VLLGYRQVVTEKIKKASKETKEIKAIAKGKSQIKNLEGREGLAGGGRSS